jgi:hypothetical protein
MWSGHGAIWICFLFSLRRAETVPLRFGGLIVVCGAPAHLRDDEAVAKMGTQIRCGLELRRSI